MIDRNEPREPVLAQGPRADEPGSGVTVQQRRQHLCAARRAGADQHVDLEFADGAKRLGQRHVSRAVAAEQADCAFPRPDEEARHPPHPIEVAAPISAKIQHHPCCLGPPDGSDGVGDLAVSGASEAVEHQDERPVAAPLDCTDRGDRVGTPDRIRIRVNDRYQASRGQDSSNKPGSALRVGRRAALLDFRAERCGERRMTLDGPEQAVARCDRRRLGARGDAQRSERQNACGDAEGGGRRGP